MPGGLDPPVGVQGGLGVALEVGAPDRGECEEGGLDAHVHQRLDEVCGLLLGLPDADDQVRHHPAPPEELHRLPQRLHVIVPGEWPPHLRPLHLLEEPGGRRVQGDAYAVQARLLQLPHLLPGEGARVQGDGGIGGGPYSPEEGVDVLEEAGVVDGLNADAPQLPFRRTAQGLQDIRAGIRGPEDPG